MRADAQAAGTTAGSGRMSGHHIRADGSHLPDGSFPAGPRGTDFSQRSGPGSAQQVPEGGIADPASRVQGSSSGPATWMGAQLRARRETLGLSHDEIARIAGFADAATVRAIERGARTRASRLRPWLAALGIEVAPFLAEHAGAIAPESRFPMRPRPPKPPRPVKPSRALAPPPAADEVASDRAALGGALWGWRIRRELSRPALARLVGVSRMTIWAVERGLWPLQESTYRACCAALRLGVAEPHVLAAKYPAAIVPDRRRAAGASPVLPDRAPTTEGKPDRRDP